MTPESVAKWSRLDHLIEHCETQAEYDEFFDLCEWSAGRAAEHQEWRHLMHEAAVRGKQ